MPYQPSGWHGGIDTQSGQILLEGSKEIGKGIGAFSESIAQAIGNKEKAAALDTSIDLINQQAPNLLGPEFLDKFHGAGVSAKAGMMTTALAMLNRQDQQGAQGKDFTLRTIQAGNTAAYQQAQVDNMAADNKRQTERDAWERKPDNQKPITSDAGDFTGVGVVGEKSGLKFFNFFKKPKPPVKPGMVVDPKTGAGYFADAQGRPVNRENLLYDPVAGGPGGPPQDNLLPPLDGAPPGNTAPATPDETPIPVGKPFSSRLQPLVPKRGARTFRDSTMTVPVQNPDGSIEQRKTILRSYDDGSQGYLQPPNDANMINGQTPEWKTIVPIRSQNRGVQAPAPTAAPVPATTTTPTTTPAPKRWR